MPTNTIATSAMRKLNANVPILNFLFILCCLCFQDCQALSSLNSNNNHKTHPQKEDASSLSRRQILIGGSTSILTTSSWSNFLPHSEVFAADSSNAAPIAVLGASGRTGALCVSACLSRGIPVRALTRSGVWVPPESSKDINSNSDINSNPLLTVSACNVKDQDEILNGVKGCQGVIYAASASKQGGKAQEIDNLGVVAAAQACLSQNVNRYVVLSSTATTRPNSLGYKFTNVLGGIMDEKRKGEEGVQQLYSTVPKSLSYTIVRPGGLEEPKKNEILGPKALEISQGDVLAGIISRADLAEATVELTRCTNPNLRNTALELYYTDSAQPCERKFSTIFKNGEAPRLHGDSYEELFRGIKPDIDYFVM